MVMVTLVVAMTLVSLFWKISGHPGTLAGSETVLLLMFGWAILPVALIPALCLSGGTIPQAR